MKRDLWKELAARVRMETTETAAMPFGFERRVLERVARAEFAPFLNPWLPMLRPALALSIAVMGICLVVQFTHPPAPPYADLLNETDALLITALFDE